MNTFYLAITLAMLPTCLFALGSMILSLVDALRRLPGEQPSFLQVFVFSPVQRREL